MKMWAGTANRVLVVALLSAYAVTAFTITFWCSENYIVPIKITGLWSIKVHSTALT